MLFIGQEDYGVFKYQEVDFFNNIQLYIYFDYLFKDYKNIQYINLEKFIGPKVRQLSSSLASLLTTVVAVFEKEWGLILDKDAKIEISGKEFTRTDYFLINSARKNIFDNNLPYELQVWLHSNLCQLNFVSIIIPKVLKNHNDLYIRFMFIAFLECAKVLKKLMNQKGVLNDKQVNQVNSILNNSVYVILAKRSVRSNIAHYQLENYDIKVFSGDNTLIDIMEYETEENFYQFWKKFNKQFTNLKLVLEELLY